jgi:hypothetical protein
MEPISLAASAAALLVTYLRHVGDQAADTLGDRLGEAAWTKLARLYERVRARVAGDRFGGRALQRLEQQPSNDRRRVVFEDVLADLLESEPEFAMALRRLVDDARQAGGPAVTQIADSGVVAGGNVHLEGTNVAGRDLTIGRSASPDDEQ